MLICGRVPGGFRSSGIRAWYSRIPPGSPGERSEPPTNTRDTPTVGDELTGERDLPRKRSSINNSLHRLHTLHLLKSDISSSDRFPSKPKGENQTILKQLEDTCFHGRLIQDWTSAMGSACCPSILSDCQTLGLFLALHARYGLDSNPEPSCQLCGPLQVAQPLD